MKIPSYGKKFYVILLLMFLFFLLFTLLSSTPFLSGFMFIKEFDAVSKVVLFTSLISLGLLLVTYTEMISRKTNELLEKIRKRKYIHREKDEELYEMNTETKSYVIVSKSGHDKKRYKGFYLAPSELSPLSAYCLPSSTTSRLKELGVDPSNSPIIYLQHRDKQYTIYLFSHEYAHHYFWKELYSSILEDIKELRLRFSELNSRFNELYEKFHSRKEEDIKDKVRSLSRMLYYVDREIELLKSGVLPGLREYSEEHSMITSILVFLQYLKEGKVKRDEVTTIIQKMIKTYTSPEIDSSYTHAIEDLFGNFSDKDPIWYLTKELMYGTYDRKLTEIVDSLMSKLEKKRKEIIEKAKIEIQKEVLEAKSKLSMIERELYELNKQN